MALGWFLGSLSFCVALLCIALYTRVLLACVSDTRYRLVLWLPLSIALFVLPRALFLPDTHVLGTAAVAVCASWWASHRALSALTGYGPASNLAASASSSFRALLRFVAVIVVPAHYILQPSNRYDEIESLTKPLARAATTMTVLQCVAMWIMPLVLQWSWLPFHAQLLPLFYAWVVYSACKLFIDICSCIAAGVFRLPTGKGFVDPWRAASVAEFWHRWNRPAQDILRDSVYFPLLDAMWNSRQRKVENKYYKSSTEMDGTQISTRIAPSCCPPSISGDLTGSEVSLLENGIAVLAVFFTSGVMHELTFFCVSGALTGELFSFFFINGLAVVAEKFMKQRYYKTYRRIPRWFRNLVTMTFLVCAANCLFFPPFLRFDMVERCRANLRVWLLEITPPNWHDLIAPQSLWNGSYLEGQLLTGMEM